MTTIELARMVKQMRDAQKSYFKARREGLQGGTELEDSKRCEKRVDTTVEGLLEDYPALLPGMGD